MPESFRLIPTLLLTGLLAIAGCSSQTATSQTVNGCQIKPQTICQGVDLSYADLSGVNLAGADLSGANLSGANLAGANLGFADLSGATLSGATLAGANLGRAVLFEAQLDGADLSGANFGRAYLSEATLYGANLAGANFGLAMGLSQDQTMDANVSGAYLGSGIEYEQRLASWPPDCLDNLNFCLVELGETLESIDRTLRDISFNM